MAGRTPGTGGGWHFGDERAGWVMALRTFWGGVFGALLGGGEMLYERLAGSVLPMGERLFT